MRPQTRESQNWQQRICLVGQLNEPSAGLSSKATNMKLLMPQDGNHKAAVQNFVIRVASSLRNETAQTSLHNSVIKLTDFKNVGQTVATSTIQTTSNSQASKQRRSKPRDVTSFHRHSPHQEGEIEAKVKQPPGKLRRTHTQEQLYSSQLAVSQIFLSFFSLNSSNFIVKSSIIAIS